MTRTRIVLPLLMLLALPVSTVAQQAVQLYQQGLVQENATGHLEDAIALYLEASRAAGSDRALAAKALIRAAGSYEKLGDRTHAASIYSDVLRIYPEQGALASVAREHLNFLRRPARATASTKSVAGSTEVSASTALVIERYCVRCHNTGNPSGELDLGTLDRRPVAENTRHWELVVRRLLARRDPPPGAPRPDHETYRAVTAELQQALDTAYATNDPLDRVDRADDVELAARVATLIWNSAPDAPLLDDARRDRLHEPAVLNRQAERMLRDPRAASLVDGFFAGWLSFENVIRARPDPSMYPNVDADLLRAMETETRLFLESQLRENRDAVEIWTANYTYLNARLAGHYGVLGVTGQAFRRVTWPDNSRAGILGQASVLTSLSYPSRTSPTNRGRFVLSRFLGVDSPSPPANVPMLAERPAEPGPMRDRLQAHKVNPSCANCHAMFDPLGIALENFDATGAWRTTDGGLPVDASGTFIDGTRFDSPAELRAGLLKYREAYYTTLTQQLLARALNRKGKPGQVYDYEMSAVRQIVRDAAGSGYRWSSILAGIANCAPFQLKHPVP